MSFLYGGNLCRGGQVRLTWACRPRQSKEGNHRLMVLLWYVTYLVPVLSSLSLSQNPLALIFARIVMACIEGEYRYVCCCAIIDIVGDEGEVAH